MRILFRYLPVLILLLSAASSAAAQLRVPLDHATIQAALDAATEGDTIILTPGRYVENVVNHEGKNLTIQSEEPTSWTLTLETIVDGDGAGAVFSFSGEETNFLLYGLSIVNGDAVDLTNAYGGGVQGNGGMIHLSNCMVAQNKARWGGGIAETNGTIKYCVIRHNVASSGGGIYISHGLILNNHIYGNEIRTQSGEGAGIAGAKGLIQGNLIENNHAKPVHTSSNSSGGGIASSSAIIVQNIIRGNTAWSTGGGVFACNIQDCVVEGNEAAVGGGGYSVSATNTIIAGNRATSRGGGASSSHLFHCVVIGNFASISGAGGSETYALKNSIIWGNTIHFGVKPQVEFFSTFLPTYSNIQDWPAGLGIGNHSMEPGFVDMAGGDYRLRSDSPNIDAGGTLEGIDTDHDGNPRPFLSSPWDIRGDGSGFDIGAFEYQHFISQLDGVLWILLGKVPASPGADTNADFTIDAADLLPKEP